MTEDDVLSVEDDPDVQVLSVDDVMDRVCGISGNDGGTVRPADAAEDLEAACTLLKAELADLECDVFQFRSIEDAVDYVASLGVCSQEDVNGVLRAYLEVIREVESELSKRIPDRGRLTSLLVTVILDPRKDPPQSWESWRFELTHSGLRLLIPQPNGRSVARLTTVPWAVCVYEVMVGPPCTVRRARSSLLQGMLSFLECSCSPHPLNVRAFVWIFIAPSFGSTIRRYR
ncbi:MAG: hypothetical protein KDA89_01105 [Planctomycetaceae bacterium]|nr:hypothetical protein [Planctomycetaceae bacterium]